MLSISDCRWALSEGGEGGCIWEAVRRSLPCSKVIGEWRRLVSGVGERVAGGVGEGVAGYDGGSSSGSWMVSEGEGGLGGG